MGHAPVIRELRIAYNDLQPSDALRDKRQLSRSDRLCFKNVSYPK